MNQTNHIVTKVEQIFARLRFDENFHLGLGDIRLTIEMQEEILDLIYNETKNLKG